MFEFMKSFKQNLSSATAEIRGKRQQLEKLRIRKEDLQAAALCKSDIIAMVEEWIDAESAKYPVALGKQLALHYGSSAPHIVQPGGSILSLLSMVKDAAGLNSAETIQKNMFFFFGKEIKEGFRRAVEAMPENKNAGPTLAERRTETAKLDAEIGKLMEDLRTLEQFINDVNQSVRGV